MQKRIRSRLNERYNLIWIQLYQHFLDGDDILSQRPVQSTSGFNDYAMKLQTWVFSYETWLTDVNNDLTSWADDNFFPEGPTVFAYEGGTATPPAPTPPMETPFIYPPGSMQSDPLVYTGLGTAYLTQPKPVDAKPQYVTTLTNQLAALKHLMRILDNRGARDGIVFPT